MRIRLNKVHGFMRFYDRTIYLKLFELGSYHELLHRIRYLVVVKSGITYVISHNYAKIKVDSYDSLPLEKHWLSIIFLYSLSEFLLKIKVTTTTMYF